MSIVWIYNLFDPEVPLKGLDQLRKLEILSKFIFDNYNSIVDENFCKKMKKKYNKAIDTL